MEGKKDCRNCVYHGKIVMGKLWCRCTREEVEPDLEGGGVRYEFAERCGAYKEE